MYIIIICLLLGALVSSILFIYKNWDVPTSFGAGIFVTFVLSLIVSTITVTTPRKTINYKIDSQYNLISLQDSIVPEGDFFIGIGSINGQMHYKFYYKYKDGFKYGQIKHTNVWNIQYSNNPRIVNYKVKTIGKGLWKYFTFPNCHTTNYIIYVPKGTIKENYNIDTK